MTIKTRNMIFLSFFTAAFAILIIDTALLFYNIAGGTLAQPVSFPIGRVYGFFAAGYSFAATILSIFLFLIYASIFILYLYLEFEKTQSLEVVFFAFFLIGCATEAARLSVPFFNLWNRIAFPLVFAGRLVLFGRILAPFALLFATVFSGTEQRQNVERNLVVLLMLGLCFAALIPLDTAIVLPNFCVRWGGGGTIFIIKALVLASAVLSMFINMRSLGSKEKTPYGFFAVALGYEICCYASSFAAVIVGFVALFSGTLVYLGALHHRYLWS